VDGFVGPEVREVGAKKAVGIGNAQQALIFLDHLANRDITETLGAREQQRVHRCIWEVKRGKRGRIGAMVQQIQRTKHLRNTSHFTGAERRASYRHTDHRQQAATVPPLGPGIQLNFHDHNLALVCVKKRLGLV
jgi:hypothetical protein